MMGDTQELQDKIERLATLSFTGMRQQALWFWFLGLGIVIPILTYIPPLLSVSLSSSS